MGQPHWSLPCPACLAVACRGGERTSISPPLAAAALAAFFLQGAQVHRLWQPKHAHSSSAATAARVVECRAQQCSQYALLHLGAVHLTHSFLVWHWWQNFSSVSTGILGRLAGCVPSAAAMQRQAGAAQRGRKPPMAADGTRVGMHSSGRPRAGAAVAVDGLLAVLTGRWRVATDRKFRSTRVDAFGGGDDARQLLQ